MGWGWVSVNKGLITAVATKSSYLVWTEMLLENKKLPTIKSKLVTSLFTVFQKAVLQPLGSISLPCDVEGAWPLCTLGSLTAPPQCRECLLASNLLDGAALACHQVLTDLGSQLLWNSLPPVTPSSPQNGADVSTVVLVSLKSVLPESQQPCLSSLDRQAFLLEGN